MNSENTRNSISLTHSILQILELANYYTSQHAQFMCHLLWQYHRIICGHRQRPYSTAPECCLARPDPGQFIAENDMLRCFFVWCCPYVATSICGYFITPCSAVHTSFTSLSGCKIYISLISLLL